MDDMNKIGSSFERQWSRGYTQKSLSLTSYVRRISVLSTEYSLLLRFTWDGEEGALYDRGSSHTPPFTLGSWWPPTSLPSSRSDQGLPLPCSAAANRTPRWRLVSGMIKKRTE